MKLEGEGRALDIISWSMSEEGVKTLIKSISSKVARKAIDKGTEGVGNIVGEVITNKAEEAIKKIGSKPSKRKQEYTDIVNSLIQHQHVKPNNNNNNSSLAGIISGSGIIFD